MIIIVLIFVGLITGLLAGLLGIGGGIITVPAMYYILGLSGIDQDYLMHICVATALASTLITSSGSSWAHHRKKAIAPSILKKIIPGLISGCILGAILSTFLSSHSLKIIFGAMAVFLAVYLFFPKLPPLHIAPHPNWTLAFFGVGIGCISTLLGIGGGIFMIPVLLGYQVPMKNVIANSSAGTLATALTGTIAYLFISENIPQMPLTVGYIYIPAFLAIGLGSLCTTSLGCKLAHTLPPLLIKRIFSIALAITGLTMIY